MTAPAAPVTKRKFPWWVYWLVLGLIILFMISPIIPVTIAENLAEANGCAMSEASVTPCIVDGKDIGTDIYNMGMMGWFFLATAPLGLGLLLIMFIAMVVHRILWGRHNQPAAVQP